MLAVMCIFFLFSSLRVDSILIMHFREKVNLAGPNIGGLKRMWFLVSLVLFFPLVSTVRQALSFCLQPSANLFLLSRSLQFSSQVMILKLQPFQFLTDSQKLLLQYITQNFLLSDPTLSHLLLLFHVEKRHFFKCPVESNTCTEK